MTENYTANPTPFDQKIDAVVDAHEKLRRAHPQAENDAVIAAKLRKQEDEFSQQTKLRQEWEAAEAETAKRYHASFYDLWRPIGWIEHRKSATDLYPVVINHKDGGQVKIEPTEISYHDKAAQDKDAILRGIVHAKGAWGAELEVDGSEKFKATAWAYAQIVGVKVKNYEPTGASLEFANEIIKHNAEQASQPTGQQTGAAQQPPAAKTAAAPPQPQQQPRRTSAASSPLGV